MPLATALGQVSPKRGENKVYNSRRGFELATMDEEFSGNSIESTPARAFTAKELVACPACSRTNAPTRAECLYCGSALPNSAAALSPDRVASPEPSASNVPAAAATEAESLFHVVAQLGEQDRVAAENPSVARLSQLTRSELSVLLSGRVAPLATATSAAQAQAISRQLSNTGITTTAIPEGDLKLQTPPNEIATLVIDDKSLTAVDRRTGAKMDTPWEDVTVIVIGRLYFTTTEVEQSRRRKQILDERQLMTDEAVVDIYYRGNTTGWRISAGSFDFSCLGNEKKPTAFENFRALVDSLRLKADKSLCDENYVRMRAALTKVWPLQETGTSWDRRRTAIRETRTTATEIDNELQFTRYSRLLSFFYAVERDDDAR